MTFPPPPTSAIDWNNLGFKVTEVNGHVECTYSTKTGEWSQPRFVADPFLRIHGMAPGLNYGMQAFEGMKAFRTPSGKIKIFRLSRHAMRMVTSAEAIAIPRVPVDIYRKCCDLAVSLNAEYVPPAATGAAMYIRPIVFGSCAQLGLDPPDEYTFVVYVMPTGTYHGSHPVDALVMEEFDRSAPLGTGKYKLGGNYAPVFPWSEKAHKAGYGITLHLDSKTHTEIDEFSTSGFIAVKKIGEDNYVMTVPESHNIISSVTSDSIQHIASSFGWNVDRRPIKFEELGSFDEVMAAGTAAALVPIRSITLESKNQKFNYNLTDKPGPACAKLLKTLKECQTGVIEDKFQWLEEVHEFPGFLEHGVSH